MPPEAAAAKTRNKKSKAWSSPLSLIRRRKRAAATGTATAAAAAAATTSSGCCKPCRDEQIEKQGGGGGRSRRDAGALASSSSGSGERFAHFEDALKTKLEADTAVTPPRQQLQQLQQQQQQEQQLQQQRTPRWADESGISPSSSCSARKSVSSPSNNVIARLMGLDLDEPGGGATPTRKQQQQQQQQQQQLCFTRAERTSTRSCGQHDFLDEMEDHLKQCDKALERIEAVMRLKKRLLYLQRSISCDRFEAEEARRRGGAAGVRAGHFRLNQRHRFLQECYGERKQLEDEEWGWYDDSPRPSRSRSPLLQQELLQQQQQHLHLQLHHRRCVSDGGGETPVFSPRACNLEAAARSMSPSPPRRRHPPRHPPRQHPAAATARRNSFTGPVGDSGPFRHEERQQSDKAASPRRLTVEEVCKLSRTESSSSSSSPTEEQEQPSPVSVLDNSNYNTTSPCSGDDDHFVDDEGERSKHGGRKRSRVARALFSSAAAAVESAPPPPPPPPAWARRVVSVSYCCADAEVSGAEMGGALSWAGGAGEADAEAVEEVALVLECMIFKRLVEETIALLCLDFGR